MARTTKKPAPTPVEAYEMHGEYTRATLPTGEYSGINPEDLVGKPTPTVSYPLGGKTNLEEEFAARDPDLADSCLALGCVCRTRGLILIFGPAGNREARKG